MIKIKKVNLAIFLGVSGCSQVCFARLNASAQGQPIKNSNLKNDGQLKCEIKDFGLPKHNPNLPVGEQTIYDFNLDIYMTGWYYNFWAETLKVISQNPPLKIREDFFGEFLGDQGEIYPYLFTWSSFVVDLRNKLEEKSIQISDTGSETFFLSKLGGAFKRRQFFFDWFKDIFLVEDIEPYYHPIYPVNANTRNHFVSEMREKGAILRIPFVSKLSYDAAHHPYTSWSIGANIQMFSQDKTLINLTLLLFYFYTAPWYAYTVELFDKIWPTIKIKFDPEHPLLIDNQNSIFKALRAIMHIPVSPAELPSYLALDPTTSQQQVTHEPVLFTVDFLQTGVPHHPIYTQGQFYVQGTND